MAASTTIIDHVDIEKWKIALAIGVPVALGSVYVYWKWRKSSKKESNGTTVSPGKNESLEAAEPQSVAIQAKNKGNKYFKGGKFEAAISCYSEAIDICPKQHKIEVATFYQNRAACWEQLKSYDKVIEDCTHALRYNDRYVKSLMRRAKAYEALGELTRCLEDITAVCILEVFQNQGSLVMADRVLKLLGKQKAEEAHKERNFVVPSRHFVRTYLSAFANDPLNEALGDGIRRVGSVIEKGCEENPEKDFKSSYHKALENLHAGKFSDIEELCNETLDNKSTNQTTSDQAVVLLLRGTIRLLCGRSSPAMQDLTALLNLSSVDKQIRSNALIKRGSLHVQEQQIDQALSDFETAIEGDPDNSDIYHHRGQVKLILEKIEEAVADFSKSVALKPEFAITHVQKCYTEYRLAFNQQSTVSMHASMKAFEETLEKFPKCAEGYALYGQALSDQSQFLRADEMFLKALDIDKNNANLFVHRGLNMLQWKGDIDGARILIKQALENDAKCEFAYETLGTIEVQRGQMPDAIKHFQSAIKLARTQIELCHLYTLIEAAKAQMTVARNFGLSVPIGNM